VNTLAFVTSKTTAPNEVGRQVLAEKAGLTLPVIPTPSDSRATHAASLMQERHATTAPQSSPVPQLAESVPVANQSPTIFKAIGYVEKADGQLEAIILQENQIQVVHIGDRIAERYRVTKITPDMVGAIDETMLQVPMVKPGGAIKSEVSGVSVVPDVKVADASSQVPSSHDATPPAQPEVSTASVPAQGKAASIAKNVVSSPSSSVVEHTDNSLGYVQESNGKIEAVLADGDSVRLVPQRQTETLAQSTPPGNSAGAAQAVQTSTVQNFKVPVTVASASLAATISPEVRFGGGKEETIIRHDSTPVASMPDEMSSAGRVTSSPEIGTVVSASTPVRHETVLTEEDRRSSQYLGNTPFEMKPIGFVQKADGELAAILSEDDGVDIVWQGARFAGHLRAVSVSPDLVEAVEDQPRRAAILPYFSPLPMSDLVSASNLGATGILPVPEHGQDGHGTKATIATTSPATFIFQSLGYVESQDGEVQAIVADGSQTYLVKRGEVFADQYQATSVDPVLVLAVRVTPAKPAPDFLSPQTDPGDKLASNELHGFLNMPLWSDVGVLPFGGLGQDGRAALSTVPDINLFNTLATGLDMQSHFHTTDNPKLGY
jgi:hypothetical protein